MNLIFQSGLAEQIFLIKTVPLKSCSLWMGTFHPKTSSVPGGVHDLSGFECAPHSRSNLVPNVFQPLDHPYLGEA